MTAVSQAAALIALLRAGRRPWQRYAELVEDAGSALAVLGQEERDPPDAPQGALFGEQERPCATQLLQEAQEDLRLWEQDGIRVLTVLDHEYPGNLRLVYDRPPLIFLAGRLPADEGRALAVIGTRRPSPGGVESAGVISGRLAALDYTVFSGLAAGIDTAAHRGALAGGGRTVAVIGTGLRRAYPPQNSALQRRIASEGAVVSQFWPDAPPSRRTFPVRNALMSGLTLATVIVEAGERSGARVQARAALAQGRAVFLLAGVLRHQWARELAERPGVHFVHCAEEITSLLDRLHPAGALTA
ncbi:MAG: DNA-protecting protein DprA [Actinomycetota bacterium]|nr:DNA-protecting protein DprA [Actinomycetota bacterium]